MALEQEKQLYLNGEKITPTQANKITLLGNATPEGEPYHFPFNIRPLVQNAGAIVGKFDTITLDNEKKVITYDITLPSADFTDAMNPKAGLYTYALAKEKLGKDEIRDDLESPMTDYALSARMGKELNETKLGIDAKITNAEIDTMFTDW